MINRKKDLVWYYFFGALGLFFLMLWLLWVILDKYFYSQFTLTAAIGCWVIAWIIKKFSKKN